MHTPVIPPHQQTCNITTKGDSAASNHYFTMRDKNTLINVQPNNASTTTTLPNHSTLQSTLQGNLPIKHCYKQPQIQNYLTI